MINEIRRLLHEQHEAIQGLDRAQQYAVAASYNRQIDKLQDQARKAFARLNGWIVAGTRSGAVRLIPKEKRVSDKMPHEMFGWGFYLQNISDHDFVCKVPGRGGEIMAVICQPYDNNITAAKKAAEHYGLAVHVPPNPFASFHFPGWTQFIVFTKPGLEVRWLAEQMVELEPALGEQTSSRS
jgi:hypothetical protein